MTLFSSRAPLAALLVLLSGATPPAPREAAKAEPPSLLKPEEIHLRNLRQLSFGGENAEACWSLEGGWFSLQARREAEGCARIYRLNVDEPHPTPLPISSGKGATTCAH